MASVWPDSVARGLEQALDLLAAAIRDCPDDLWEAPMWAVPLPGPEHPFLDADWNPVTDASQRPILAERWVRRWSTPWSVAWHALETFDYDLNGEFGPWTPPPPFAGHPHWRDLPGLDGAWSPAEILGYVGYCRGRVGATLEGMTDEQASTPLPPAHRYHGQPHASIIVGLVGHTTEHASQIRQRISGPDIAP